VDKIRLNKMEESKMKLGYTLFYVDDVKSTMTFYSKAFGLQVGFLHESNQYGEMVTGDTKLGFVNHETASSHGFE
jgi:lactoylglutathione lyase